jgi:hypothetical protein
MHPNRPDLRQRNRPGMNLADADPGTAIWSPLVADTEAVLAASFALAFRKPTPRSPRSAYRARPRLRSTAASSKTWEETSFRQESPVTCLVVVPSGATAKTRPAPSLAFQRLNALIKSKLDQGTLTDGSAFSPASASVTS